MSNQPNQSPHFIDAFAPAIRKQMQLAILCGRLNCALSGSDVWDHIPCAGDAPTPEELIVWAALEVLRRTAEEENEEN